MNMPLSPSETLFHHGTARMAEGDAAGAEDAFRRALELAPDLAEAHANLGLLLDGDGRWPAAESHYRQALELNPGLAQTHGNLGTLLAAQKRFPEAEAACRLALALDPDAPDAWSNLGVLLACLKREEEAEECYRKALALDPAYARAAFNLAYLLLRQGRYDEGWARLEARGGYAPLHRHLACPRWQGEALAGKSILVGIEAGHGDMIQFCRYAALLKGKGAARVSILCHPGLKTLFANLAGVDEALAPQELHPEGWDYWVPPLSLPFLFQTRRESIPAALPYLAAEPERVRRWAGILGNRATGLRVGLVWKGNPRFENDVDRSLPALTTLAPLGEIPGVTYVSLQKGAGEEEARLPASALKLTVPAATVEDFADTAAIVANLDLVIAVDTAVAHLAGALGKPCWVLLPAYKTDWRWLTGREDSPWYPDVLRLFRQEAMGDWAPVVTRLTDALRALTR